MFEFRIIAKCDVCGKILSEDACDIDDFYGEPETVEFYYEDAKVYIDEDEFKYYSKFNHKLLPPPDSLWERGWTGKMIWNSQEPTCVGEVVDHLPLNRHYPNNPPKSSFIPVNKRLKHAPNKGYGGGFHQLFLTARPRSPPGD